MFYSVYNLEMSGSEWGCDWESFRTVGARRIWAESRWYLFISNQVSIFPCIQTLSCSLILSFPWWLFCSDFCCKKQINTWNFVILNLAWQCTSAGCCCWGEGDAGQGKASLPTLTAPLGNGAWKWGFRASKCSFSSYFGLKKLVWVGSQPHSCCIDFSAVLMGAN